MNNSIKITLLSFLMMIGIASASAQQNAPVEMASGLYQSGKIYVVVIVISVIFIGITGYLISLDRKISKLEKEAKNK
jgi:CcmD family protein